MAREKLRYQCGSCGASHNRWVGQCTNCGAWNTLQEVRDVGQPSAAARFSGYSGPGRVKSMSEVSLGEKIRTSSGLRELDRVLGGGLVQGSVILIGGDPGIGKSTLLLQTLAAIQQLKSLYVSGEESVEQITLRARRLHLDETGFRLLAETGIESILETARIEKPQLMVIDSIQTLFTERIQSAPGSVAQVRECAARLVGFAKQTNTAVFVVGHVTKEGALAGPRVLEHMVDSVLYFEGDSGSRYRILRAVKNRFGAVNELGVFAMTEMGLKGVSNPSSLFISRHETPVSGSTIMVTLEGTRPLLVEIQALVDESHLANPRRIAVGLEQHRLAMLLAVLHKHGNIPMYDQDVFVNVVGGIRVTETGADLPVLLATLSSFRNKPLPADLAVFGEVGLAGEIRPVPNGLERLQEAIKHGFKRAIIPKANTPKKPDGRMDLLPAQRLLDVLDRL